ncbi:MAG: glycosyl hydrolase [Phycisphaeraceae bacterium JB051]
MHGNLRQAFSDPAPTWRAIPFWSLNDRLDLDEIRRQLQAFKRGGFGGAYLHSRIGLLTPYLGDDWWEAMDAGVDECQKLGIEAWFYDEDKWPSGFAGGIVPLQSDDYHARYIARISHDRQLPEDATLLAKDEHWQYACCKVQMGNAWFNGTCWVDLLNPDMVKAFIDCTYQPYAQRYAKNDRNILRGIFTDEPQFNPRWTIADCAPLPFSPIILDDFKQRCGYDLTDHMASLYDDVDDLSAKVRLDYFRTLGWRLEQSFTRQIADYCSKTDMTWTGHYNGEQWFLSILQNVGNMMIQYRHMQQPGIDHLGLSFGHMPDIHAMRALSSVANQYGQQRRLSEMFGISGQNMSFEDRCWIADGHAIMGINHICPHLTLYSMKGCRKRDYPPTISPQQPWWEFNKPAEDRMARSAMLSSQGKYAAELLVIHPLESAYIDLTHGGHGKQQPLTDRYEQFLNVIQVLQDHHRDYDLGDEQILADIGKVTDGKLQVGQMCYDCIVIPCMATIRPTTLTLIEQLLEAGGKVIIVDHLPQRVEGLPDDEAIKPLKNKAILTSANALASTLAHIKTPAVTLTGQMTEQVWIHRRIVDDKPLVMLLNRNRLHTINITVDIKDLTDPICFNPTTNLVHAVNQPIELELAPAQTLFIGDGSLCPEDQRDPMPASKGAVISFIDLADTWQLKRDSPNSITLDFASISKDAGQTWGAYEPVLAIHERMTRDQWSGDLTLRYKAKIDTLPSDCSLVIEQSQIYSQVRVNGKVINTSDQTFWTDRTMHCQNITELLQVGEILIELDVAYVAPMPTSLDAVKRYGTEIENVYLIGNFGVNATVSDKPQTPTQRSTETMLPNVGIQRFNDFSMGDEISELADITADLTLHGYPFFTGQLRLTTTFDLPDIQTGKRYWLELDRPNVTVVVPTVNGQKLQPLAWCPWELDITDSLINGENTIELELVNSLRNLLGPLHHRDGELTRVAPQSFGGGSSWTCGGQGDDDWYDARLEREPRIWRDDYHMVALGLGCVPRIVVREG